MDLMRQLDTKDIINIAKMAMISRIYNKHIDQLITEIDSKRSVELSEKVKDYFIKENISKTLPNHNRELNILLDDKSCYINRLNMHNSKTINAKDAKIIYDNNDTIKIFQEGVFPLLTKEWLVYTYIIPFIYYSNMSFNVLVPKTTGKCLVSNLATNRNFSSYINNRNLSEKLMFINTPYVEKSLYDILFLPNFDLEYHMFQIIYNMTCFSKLGLIHNDLHSRNVRVTIKRPEIVKFVINDELNFNVMVEEVPLIYDFDYSGIDEPMKGLLDKYGISTKNYMDTSLTDELSLTYNNDGGRRDLILFLGLTTFVFYDMHAYLSQSYVSPSENAIIYLNESFNANIRNNVDFNNFIKKVKESNLIPKLHRRYEDLLNLLIFVTNGKVKLFFQSIKSKKYFPKNDEWRNRYIKKHRQEPSSHEWVFDLLYRNAIPECPLKVPYTDEVCMTPLKLIKTEYFQNFVEKSSRINKNFGDQPTSEVSINISEEQIIKEYDRFMFEFFLGNN